MADERICGKCGRAHPNHWAVPFTLPPQLPGLREAHKQGMICSWCWRDYKGRRRPLADEYAAGRLLHSLLAIPSIKDPKNS